MSINSRLREVMKYKGLNIKTFAELLESPYRTIQNYLLNERDPSVNVLIGVSQKFNIDLNWLLLGEGEMLKNTLNQNQLTAKEISLIQNYREISDEAKKKSLIFLSKQFQKEFKIDSLHN